MRVHRTIIFRIAVSLVFVIVLISCSNTSLDTDELRVVLSGNPDTLDPHRTSATITTQVNNSIYESLFYSDGTPWLIKSYMVKEGGKKWVFVLKKGVLFHHQKELQAEDVIASLLRLQEEGGDTPSPFAKQYSVIKNITAENSHTVAIELEYKYNGFKALLSSSESVILPADLIRNRHNFNLSPVGTGAFMFHEWQQNKVIRLKKNTYYRDYVFLQKVSFIVIKDRSSQLQALYKQEVDMVPYLGEIESQQVRMDNGLKGVNKPGSTILVLAMNLRNPVLSSLETRRAIAKAIDKKRIIDIAYNGGNELNVFWHKESDFFLDVPSEYNPSESKSYFEKNPIRGTLTISVPSIFRPHVRAAEMYQAMLDEVGVSTVIEEVEWGVWLNRVFRKGIFDMTVIGHTGELDPDLRLSDFGKGTSYVGWKNNDFVTLVDEARVTSDSVKRIQLYQSALQIMTQEQPFVFIAENEVTFGVTNRVQSFEFDQILERYDFRETKLSN